MVAGRNLERTRFQALGDNFFFCPDGLQCSDQFKFGRTRRQVGMARFGAVLLISIALAACAGVGDQSVTYTDDRGVANQPFPVDFKVQLLSFLRTYLNNPVGVHYAAMAEPVQRTVGGRLRYVSCIRYDAKDSEGVYRGQVERAVVYVDGRLDRIIEKPADLCAGLTYAMFPEMEKMAR